MQATPVLYGISNCDTVRRTKRWLDAEGVSFRFHDFRKDGLARSLVEGWLTQVSIDSLINRRGTTWRALDDVQRAALLAGDLELLLAQPTLIKRPVMDAEGKVLVGFDEASYRQLLEL